MNLIEQLFNDFNAKYLEEAKARNIDLGLQTIYTPIDKLEKVTGFRFADHITSETKSVAVLFNTEFINYFIKELPQDYINNMMKNTKNIENKSFIFNSQAKRP